MKVLNFFRKNIKGNVIGVNIDVNYDSELEDDHIVHPIIRKHYLR